MRIPGNGGASVSVIAQFEDDTGISTGCLVLYGVTGALRVPLAVGYLARLDAGGPSLHAIFRVAGLAFDHFEIDAGGWYNTGEGTGDPYLTVTALVGGLPAPAPVVHVLERCIAVQAGTWVLPALLDEQLWQDRTIVRSTSARRILAVTPSDANNLTYYPCDGVIVSATGILKVTDASGATSSPVLAAGVVHPLRLDRVWSTGTAAGILAAGVWAVYEG